MIRLLISFVLVCVVSLAPRPARAFGSCTDADYLHAFDRRLTPGPCEVVATTAIRWAGGSTPVRVVRLRSTASGDDAAVVRQTEALAAAVGEAMTRVGDVTLGEVTIFLTNYISPIDPKNDIAKKGEIEAWASDHHGECPISLFKQDARLRASEFRFILSHEIFHCIQYKRWQRLPEQPWITEGTAEWFAALANPGTTYADGRVADFDAAIGGTPITAMEYEAVVFFSWLGQTHGVAAITQLIGAAERGAAADALVDAETWNRFAQSYLDGAINWPFGARMPVSPRLSPDIEIDETSDFAMPAIAPFAISNFGLKFAHGKSYALTTENIPADGRFMWRKAAGGAWASAGSSPIAACDEDQRYRAAWTTVRSPGAGVMHVAAREVAPGACRCPAGVWLETQESLRAYFEHSLSGEVEFKSGSRTLTLNEDQTGTLAYDGITFVTRSSPGIWSRVTLNGTSHFAWRTAGGTLFGRPTVGADNLLTNRSELHANGAVSVQTTRVGAQSIGHKYSCEGNMLHLTTPPRPLPADPRLPYVARNVDMHFERIGGPVPPGRN